MRALILLTFLLGSLSACNTNHVNPEPEKQEEVEKTLHLDRQRQQDEHYREVNTNNRGYMK